MKVIFKTFAILAMMAIVGVSLAGCGVPKGYAREGKVSSPIIPIESEQVSQYLLDVQFETFNSGIDNTFDGLYINKTHFTYDGDEYHVIVKGSAIWESTYQPYVVMRGTSQIGTFIHKKNTFMRYNFSFLDEDKLYYGYIRGRTQKRLRLDFEHGFSIVKITKWYVKHEYCSFDMKSGKNENVDVDLFFEKLCNHTSDFKLNK